MDIRCAIFGVYNAKIDPSLHPVGIWIVVLIVITPRRYVSEKSIQTDISVMACGSNAEGCLLKGVCHACGEPHASTWLSSRCLFNQATAVDYHKKAQSWGWSWKKYLGCPGDVGLNSWNQKTIYNMIGINRTLLHPYTFNIQPPPPTHNARSLTSGSPNGLEVWTRSHLAKVGLSACYRFLSIALS